MSINDYIVAQSAYLISPMPSTGLLPEAPGHAVRSGAEMYRRRPRAARGGLASVLHALGLWQERVSQRRALRALDAYLLDDIGLTRRDAVQESRKPFWKP